MQRSIDAWYRDQPEAFPLEPETSVEDQRADTADRAIALNHLLAYGRLAAERDLAALSERAATDGNQVLPALLNQAEARNARLLESAPPELHSSLRTGLASITERLMHRASSIDVTTAARWRAAAIEQSVQLGEAVLREDPEQYAQLVADAETMMSKLGLDTDEQRKLFDSIRQRYAAAARNSKPRGETPSHQGDEL